MQIVMILVPVTLILVALGIVLFSWAVKNGQYEDLEGPAHRILYDDDKELIPGDARQDKSGTTQQSRNKQPGTTEDSDNIHNA
ncbi:MAG: cbb3-type cytochrome oxidase assembly protein CcoS [Marinobacter sp.]|nr:cbb3-type cytochrome oxidase assembly protein CcoS [Marinobacter sp.]